MIIAKVFGGLGNQMFQYAAGRSLALAHDCQLKLDLSWFDTYRSYAYQLNLFGIKAEISTAEESSRFVGSFPRLARMLRKGFGVGKKSYYVERGFAFDKGFYDRTPPLYMDGYWQSWKYFESNAKQIKEELTLSIPMAGRNLELSQQIARVNSVSIHIRRGDYVTNHTANAVHGFVGLEYYNAALRQVSESVPAPFYVVFSDDLEWARRNLGIIENVVFVDHNRGASSYEDMRMMSLCQHHILANSSFSWWAAWLGYHPGKQVLYPSNWFATRGKDISLLCPPGWIRVSAEMEK